MKLVIAVAAVTTLGIVGAAPFACFAQDAAAEAAPALRSDSDAAVAPTEPGAVAPAPGAAIVATPAVAPPDPAAQLAAQIAEARGAAMAAAALPGAVSDPLIANVADYAMFQRALDAIADRAIEEPEDLDIIMDTLAGYDGGTLPDALYSYGAFIAAQQPVFVDKVREVAEFYGVAQLVQGMINEPEYVLSFDGAREAADLVLSVVRQDVAELGVMSARFKQASYDLQTEGWSNLIAEDRPERLGRLALPQRLDTPSQQLLAEVAYGAPISAADAAAGQRRTMFWSALDYRPAPARPSTAPDRNAEAIGVMMTLGALRALNVSQSRPDLVTQLLNLPTAKDCLAFSKLHLEQCIAAAHFKYEDAFCIAEHQLLDANQCLGETVNAPEAIVRTPPLIAQAGTEVPVEAPASVGAPAAVGVSADEVLGLAEETPAPATPAADPETVAN